MSDYTDQHCADEEYEMYLNGDFDKKKKATTQAELNKLLIEHYDCFNRERFFLDEFSEKNGMCSIATSSIADTCPVKLCKGIAKFVKKNINADKFSHIYVGAYAFLTKSL